MLDGNELQTATLKPWEAKVVTDNRLVLCLQRERYVVSVIGDQGRLW